MTTQPSPTGETPTLQPQPDPPGRLSNKRRLQLGVAIVVTLIALAGTFGRPKRATGTTPPAAAPLLAPSPEAVTRERERIDRAARPVVGDLAAAIPQEQPSTRAPVTRAQVDGDPASYGGGVYPAAQAERRQREEESLFADTRVALDGERPARQRTPTTAPAAAADRLPTADELTRDIIAELGVAAPARPQQPQEAALAPVGTLTEPARSEQPVRGLHRLYEGYLIDGTLLNRLTGDADGPVNVQVSNAAYAPDGVLVIPAGAHVLGRARRVQTAGTSRVVVTFHRLLILQPDGTTRSVSLDQFDGLNGIGDVGLRDQVNRHYLATFGASAAVGLISGISQAIGAGGYGIAAGGDNNTVLIGGGITDATSQAISQTLNQFLNRPWTITIREGKRVKVWLTDDVDLPAYGWEGGRR